MAEAAPVVRAPRKERPEPVHRDEPPRVAQPTERQEPGPQPSSARETAPPSSADAGGPSPAYLALLRQKLERSKVYPRAARQRRQEGTTIVRFVVDREGRVLSRHIEKSSGYGDLDREVDAMLDRAQPLPRMPTEMVQASIELVVPIDFHLR
ncbi:MAG: TonB family protein [Gemmatimonas sp.]